MRARRSRSPGRRPRRSGASAGAAGAELAVAASALIRPPPRRLRRAVIAAPTLRASPRRGRRSATMPAAVHHQHAVAHAEHLGQLARDHQDRHALAARAGPSARWISALAPTSMPRVGSSMMRMRGSVASHLPSTTFCWLPPESWPTTCSGPRARMPSCLIEAARAQRPRAEVDEDAAGDAARATASETFSRDGHRPDQALQAAILGHIGDAEVARLPRRWRSLTGWPSSSIVARGRRRDAEDRQRELGAAGADEAGDAEDLAAPELEGDVADPVAEARGRVTSRTVSPIFGSGLGNRWSISRPTIIATSVCSLTSAIGAGADQRAVAQHRHAVGELEDLRQLWLT